MADSSLRRSSRRSKKRTFSVGDIVEIIDKNDGDRILKTGQLLSESASRSSSPSTWLVGFDDKSSRAEKYQEDSLGEIVGKASPSPDTVVQSTAFGSQEPTASSVSRKAASRNVKKKQVAASSLDNENQKQVSNPDTSPSSYSGSARNVDKKNHVFSGKRAASAAAREQRSKRRQAQQPTYVSVSRPVKKYKISKKKKEPAIKIPMLTGTLFLYRGRHRRAEFVRKV